MVETGLQPNPFRVQNPFAGTTTNPFAEQRVEFYRTIEQLNELLIEWHRQSPDVIVDSDTLVTLEDMR